LELAMALVKEHQAAHGTGYHRVFVLDSELEQNHEIYDAALRRIGGTYIAVDKLVEPRIKGTLDAGLRDLVKEGLQLSAIGLNIDVVQERDYIVVRRADGIEPVNESELLILEFVAALFSEELGSHTIGAISWTETRLELRAKEALWQLIRAQIGGRRLGSLTTLVFVAGGRVEPEIHCEHEASVLFALTERGLSKRKTRLSLSTAVGKLVRNSASPFVLFLGAGASASAGMPLGNEARDYALERFFSTTVPPPVSQLALNFHRWICENGRLLAGEEGLDSATFVERLTLERVLREEFHRDGREESPTLRHLIEKNKNAIERKRTRVRRALRTIIERPQRLIIVTLNFDMILEDEFGDGLQVFATTSSFTSAVDYLNTYCEVGGKVPVLKLHGSLDVPSSIVADVDTRSLGLAPGAAEALQRLRGEPHQRRPWVYIGASMRDPDVTEVIGSSDFAERLDEWWVSPFPDPAVWLFVDEHRDSRWKKGERAGYHERQITETAEIFLSALARAWPNSTSHGDERE
jgi:hypothetical protein